MTEKEKGKTRTKEKAERKRETREGKEKTKKRQKRREEKQKKRKARNIESECHGLFWRVPIPRLRVSTPFKILFRFPPGDERGNVDEAFPHEIKGPSISKELEKIRFSHETNFREKGDSSRSRGLEPRNRTRKQRSES